MPVTPVLGVRAGQIQSSYLAILARLVSFGFSEGHKGMI